MHVQCTTVHVNILMLAHMFDLGGSAWEILLFIFFLLFNPISSGMERSGIFGFNFTNLGKGLVKPYCMYMYVNVEKVFAIL